MKKTGLTGTGVFFSTKRDMVWAEKKSVERGKPEKIRNILFLFVDQQRQDCIGCYGNPIVRTPNIDRLASNGIRFNNAFTPTPLCSPARTSLQTGIWAHNSRVMFNTGQGGLAGGVNDPDPRIGFFSNSLKEKEWQLAHIGKWHIGSEKNKPSDHGYEGIYYPGYGIPSPIYGPPHKHYLDYLKTQSVSGFNFLSEKRDPSGSKLYSGLQEGPQSASIPTYLTNQTIEYIKRFTGNNSPFFISCNFWGPHEPYCIPKKHYEMYKDTDIDVWPNFNCDLSDKPVAVKRYGDYWKTGWFNRKSLSELIAEYFGYITLIDEEIGRILKALDDAGELERTLIIYSADHGSTVGSYRMWAKGFGMYDVVTRIPLIVSHQSIRSSVSDAFVTLLDLAPTFLEIAGCEVTRNMDGSSLMSIMCGKKKGIREDYIVTEAFGHVVPFWQRMVRTQSSKYIYSPTSNDEFYDLESDPYETRNIIDAVDKKTLNRHKDILITEMEKNKDTLLYWAKSTILD